MSTPMCLIISFPLLLEVAALLAVCFASLIVADRLIGVDRLLDTQKSDKVLSDVKACGWSR
jgi:hypothetical protein